MNLHKKMKKKITIFNLPVEKYYNMDNLVYVLNKLSYKYIIYELDSTITTENLYAIIQYSDVIIIPGQKVFNYFGDGLMEKIISYYESGGTILYEVDSNVTEKQNLFLNAFEMKFTGIRLRTRLNYDIPFAMSDHSFRDRYLYKGIDQIILTQPNHIEYWGNSEPILRSNGNFLSIDSRTDLAIDFENRLITPIVFQENKNEGLFIGINGYIKIIDMINIVDKSNNTKFLCNLYEMIFRKKSRYENAYSEYRLIEKLLLSLVKLKLKINNANDWTEYIPIKVYDEINRSGREIDNIENALNFIQLKKIIAHNWNLFQEVFDNGNKSKSLSWIDYVNEKRKDIAHPVKDINDHSITYEVVDKLKEIRKMLMKISEH
jgi:hypothetical protein